MQRRSLNTEVIEIQNIIIPWSLFPTLALWKISDITFAMTPFTTQYFRGFK